MVKWIVYIRLHSGVGEISKVKRVGSVKASDPLVALELGKILAVGKHTSLQRACVEVRKAGIKPLEKVLEDAAERFEKNRRRCTTTRRGRPSRKEKEARERYRQALEDADQNAI